MNEPTNAPALDPTPLAAFADMLWTVSEIAADGRLSGATRRTADAVLLDALALLRTGLRGAQ